MLTKIVQEFANDIAKLVRIVMESNVGINGKVGKNTLKDSDIYRELSVYATSDGDLVMDIMLNDYIQYIENGRRKGAKMPPIEAIVKWCKEKNISTDNSTIFLIRRAISREGVEPHPIMAKVFQEMDNKWDNSWGDKLFESITEQLSKFFNQ